ncbi:MAG: lytic murein transglycosylase [Pseudomonadota bacterium]|nr:lytic murein transglycosylase [Pseudomonadota bacterium]
MTSLANRLGAEKGIEPQVAERYLIKTGLVVDPAIVAKNLKQVEKQASYDYFLTEKPLDLALEFLKNNAVWLEKMEHRFLVSKELVAAIFLLESHFGTNGGRYPLLKVFTSLSLCDQEPLLRQTYDLLKQSYPEIDYQWLAKRAARKSSWAYGQLKALLKMRQRVNIAQLKGSWAGAFGIPQFIPSSFLSYAVDGNDDGTIDLYLYQDAAASVMNYLNRHGWKEKMTSEKEEKVIWSYNHSKLYVQTILAIRDQLLIKNS